MSAAHTPGPWAFRPSESDSNLFQVLDAQGVVIGFVFRGDRAATRAVCEANARLIAAAPDLLQELRNIANADTVEWDDRSEFEAWAKSRARAAIAKVEGGAS